MGHLSFVITKNWDGSEKEVGSQGQNVHLTLKGRFISITFHKQHLRSRLAIQPIIQPTQSPKPTIRVFRAQFLGGVEKS